MEELHYVDQCRKYLIDFDNILHVRDYVQIIV
jgi:hypothetical protein